MYDYPVLFRAWYIPAYLDQSSNICGAHLQTCRIYVYDIQHSVTKHGTALLRCLWSLIEMQNMFLQVSRELVSCSSTWFVVNQRSYPNKNNANWHQIMTVNFCPVISIGSLKIIKLVVHIQIWTMILIQLPVIVCFVRKCAVHIYHFLVCMGLTSRMISLRPNHNINFIIISLDDGFLFHNHWRDVALISPTGHHVHP